MISRTNIFEHFFKQFQFKSFVKASKTQKERRQKENTMMLMLHNKCSKKVFFVLQTSSRGLYKLQTMKNEVNIQLTFFSQIKWGSTFPITQKLQIRNRRYSTPNGITCKIKMFESQPVGSCSIFWSCRLIRFRRNSLYFHLIWLISREKVPTDES